MSRRRLLEALDGLLEPERSDDACPNGLQVEGRDAIASVVTGVSACAELFERAVDLGADAVLVHHGLFWRGDERTVTGVQRRRLGILIEHDVNLIAYHLPLDRHPVVGNNALAARAFGIEAAEPFPRSARDPIGIAGELGPISPDAFERRCGEVFGQPPLAFAHGPDPIRSAAFVSGAAERMLHDAIAEGHDAFVTGEVSEWVPNLAREAGVHFFAAGHHATERLGIAELGRWLAAELGIDETFVDVANPV